MEERYICGRYGSLEGLELARAAVDIAGDKQAANIVLLDARDVCTFTDYFVICSGDNIRQIRTIYDEIEFGLKFGVKVCTAAAISEIIGQFVTGNNDRRKVLE